MEEHRESSIKFGVLGCADIFRKLRRAIQMAEGASLHAIGSRSLDKVKAFAPVNNIQEETKLYGSYQEVIDEEEVDVVYIPLPTSLHVEWAVKAAEKNKHILLEKPPALTVEDLDKILANCDSHGIQLMEGIMWVNHRKTVNMDFL